jgi:hypothetical protein
MTAPDRASLPALGLKEKTAPRNSEDLEAPEPLEPREPDDLAVASTASPIITAAEITCDGESETIPCAQPPSRRRKDARAVWGKRGRRSVMAVAKPVTGWTGVAGPGGRRPRDIDWRSRTHVTARATDRLRNFLPAGCAAGRA